MIKQELLLLEQKRAVDIFEKENISITGATVEELYKLAEINPKLFGTKYARWGCVFKCVKCNHYKVNTGGIRSLLQISRIVNEQKYIHRNNKCKHPKWEEKWSLHAAELPHTYVEETAGDSHTGNTTETDITDAVITSGNFVTGRKYLILVRAHHGGNSTAGNFRIRTLHGTVLFAGSDHTMEPTSTTALGTHYTWFTVWTAISSEGIKQQFRTNNSGDTVTTDQNILVSLELSEDLTEDSDWHFNFDGSQRTLTDTPTADATITIQTADHEVGDTYLVMHFGRLDQGTIGNLLTRLDRTGEATSTTPTLSQETEDSGQDFHILFSSRTFDLGASDNTFASFNWREVGGNGIVQDSAMFAINLEKFQNSNEEYTDGTINMSTTNWATQLENLSLVTDQAGDVFILGSWTANHKIVSSTVGAQHRLQTNGSDTPADQTSHTLQSPGWDGDDLLPMTAFTIQNLTASTHTFDMEGDFSNASGTPTGENRSLAAFSLELAGGASRTLYQSINTQMIGTI